MTDREMRSEIKIALLDAQKEYEVALKVVKRAQKSIKPIDGENSSSTVDLNKLAHLATIHDQLMANLTVSYELKNKKLLG